MKKKTVCILTAGSGSRMQNYSKNFNKALLPINKKSVISSIIEKFPLDSNFIIAVGYKKELIIEFLKINHPKNNFKFVEVKNFSGKRSGPGHSLYMCKKYLNKPFYFISCDTLWNGEEKFLRPLKELLTRTVHGWRAK